VTGDQLPLADLAGKPTRNRDCAILARRPTSGAPEYWRLICNIAEYTVQTWRKPSNGIWERDQQRHYVMSWRTLKRALEFADRVGENGRLRQSRMAMTEIHTDAMQHGWTRNWQMATAHCAP
jgi:GH15 family glucan-1,4-alpha-glucosidase